MEEYRLSHRHKLGDNWLCQLARTGLVSRLDNIVQREFNKALTWTLRRTWLKEMDVERV